MTPQDWITIIGLLSGSSVLTAVVVGWYERRKKKADAADIIANAAAELSEQQATELKRIKDEYERATEQLKQERTRGDRFESELKILRDELETLKQEKKYQAVCQAVPDPIVVAQLKSGKIVDFNEAALLIYGYSREELLALKIQDLLNDPRDTRHLLDPMLTNIPCRILARKDQSTFPADISKATFQNGDGQFSIVLMRVLDEMDDINRIKLKITAYLNAILVEYQADWVTLWRFHNGTYDALGVPIMKLSAIGEVHSSDSVPLSASYQNMPSTIFYDNTQLLLTEGVVVFDPLADRPMNNVIKAEMIKGGMGISYMAAVYDIDGKIIGALTLNYRQHHILDASRFGKLMALASRGDYLLVKYESATAQLQKVKSSK